MFQSAGMRKTLKFFHSLASCGMIGALVGYMALLTYGPHQSAADYADIRQAILVLCNYVLVPSLGVVLLSGFVSMLAHKPFQKKGWVWTKACTTVVIFESTLGVVQSKATYAAEVSMQIARGELPASALQLGTEWNALFAITALAVGNVLFAVWRPNMKNWRYQPA